MDKREVIMFFDSMAETWDADMDKSCQKTEKILDAAGVTHGKAVLDIACGTGVLIPDYLNRNVKKCVGVDISPKMIGIAKSKFSGCENIEFLCADAETFNFTEKFDCAVIYNAFPHFVDRVQLFQNISKHLDECGRITIAHGMGRDALAKHHSGIAKNVSTVLPEAHELAELMKTYFEADIIISTDEIYIVSGKKK